MADNNQTGNDNATSIRRPKRTARRSTKGNPRSVRKLIAYSVDELELLEARAEAAGLPVAVFVRLSSLEYSP